MPNRIKLAMTEEYRRRLSDGSDLVAVDIVGLTVEEASEFRNEARSKGIEIFVVKNSIARRVLNELSDDDVKDEDFNEVFAGPTALVYGGDGLPDVARLIHAYGRKVGKLAVRGGMFDKKVVDRDDVKKFKDIPDRETLLAQTIASIIAPMTGLLAAATSLLSAPAALTEALEKKKREAGEA